MPYMDKIVDLIKKHPEISNEVLMGHIFVKHDSDCPMLSGGNECLCDPDVELILPTMN